MNHEYTRISGHDALKRARPSFNSIIKVSLHLIRKIRNNCFPNVERECGPHRATVSRMQIGENLVSCRTIRTFFTVQMRAKYSRVSSAVRNRLAVTNPSFADAERVPLTTHAAQCAQACTRYSYAKAFAAGRMLMTLMRLFWRLLAQPSPSRRYALLFFGAM